MPDAPTPDAPPPEMEEAAADTANLEESDEAEDALALLFEGRIAEVMPEEDLQEFHDFIREEGIRRRRFAVSFRMECRCLAWIGYQLANLVTHEDGMEFAARPIQTYVPDHEPDVEHPEGATEEPPEEFEDWPIWPFEIYQDEFDALDHEVAVEHDAMSEGGSALEEGMDEVAGELGLGGER